MDTPTRWGEVGNWLSELGPMLMSRVTSRPYEEADGWEKVAESLFDLEERTSLEADVVARAIAQTSRLPEKISSDVAFILIYRVECALDFTGMIFPPKSIAAPFSEIPSDWTISQTAAWLLTDLWHRRYDHWLKLVAIGLCGPFAFYGLVPTDPDEAS